MRHVGCHTEFTTVRFHLYFYGVLSPFFPYKELKVVQFGKLQVVLPEVTSSSLSFWEL